MKIYLHLIALILTLSVSQAYGQSRIANTQTEKFQFIGNNNIEPEYDVDNDPFWSPQLTLYPNPVGDNLHYNFGRTLHNDVQLSVFNALGQVVISQMVNDQAGTISFAGLDNGIYLVQVDNGQGSKVYKVRKGQ